MSRVALSGWLWAGLVSPTLIFFLPALGILGLSSWVSLGLLAVGVACLSVGLWSTVWSKPEGRLLAWGAGIAAFLIVQSFVLGQGWLGVWGSLAAPSFSILWWWLCSCWLLLLGRAMRLGLVANWLRFLAPRLVIATSLGWLLLATIWPQTIGGSALGHPLNLLMMGLLATVILWLDLSPVWRAAALLFIPFLWIFGDSFLCLIWALGAAIILRQHGRPSCVVAGPLLIVSGLLATLLFLPGTDFLFWPRFAALARPSWSAMLEVGGGLGLGELLFGAGVSSFAEVLARHLPASLAAGPFWSIAFDSGVSALGTLAVQWGLVGLILLGIWLWQAVRWLYLPLWKVALSLVVVIFWPLNSLSVLFLLTLLVIDGEQKESEGLNHAWGQGWSTAALLTGVFGLLFSLINGWATANVWRAQQLTAAEVNEGIRLLDQTLLVAGRDSRVSVLMSDYLLEAARQELVKDKPDAQKISRLAEAAVHYSVRATNASPTAPLMWVHRSNVYLQLASVAEGADALAVDSAKRAVDLAPFHPATLTALGMAQASLADKMREVQPEVEGQANPKLVEASGGARSAYRLALSVRPAHLPARLGWSMLELRAGDKAAATRVLEEGLAVTPNDVTLLTQLGLMYSTQGKLDQAKATLEQALTLAPKTANARWYLTYVEEARGNIEAAFAQLAILEDLLPDNQALASRREQLEKARRPAISPPITPAPLVDEAATL